MPSLFESEEAIYDRYAACLAATEGLRRIRNRQIEHASERMKERSGSRAHKNAEKRAAATYYREQARGLELQIAKYWDQNAGYIRATYNYEAGVDYKYSGLDTAVILGALHADIGDNFYDPSSDRVLATTTLRGTR